jgi:hypothetical protein
VTVHAVLAEAFAVIRREDEHRIPEVVLFFEHLADSAQRVVDPADCGAVGTAVVGSEGLELGRGRVLVDVHEVEIEEEGAVGVVCGDHALRLLENAIRMGPDGGAL